MAVDSYTGYALSFWPPETREKNWSIVEGVRKISCDIITVCLLKRGEDPLHPELGIAVDLFDPLSKFPAQYWMYSMREEILKWVSGRGGSPILRSLDVSIPPDLNAQNQLKATILFQPRFSPGVHTLAFPFYRYQGAIQRAEIGPFLKEIYLDDSKFMDRFQ